eukprot:201611_1
MGNKIYYYCPSCGDEVWAYSGFEGNTCWGCKGSKPFVNKGSWYDLMDKRAAKLPSNLSNFFDASGGKVTLTYNSGKENVVFVNVLPKKRWQKASNYNNVSTSYTCGLNAINMGLKMWDYGFQWKLSNYSYKYFGNAKWGMSGSDFYEKNVQKAFKHCGYKYHETFAGIGSFPFKWDYIDNNNYTQYCIIGMGGYGLGAHYFLIIGVDEEKQHYLITDQTKNVWVAGVKLMRTALIYQNNGYSQHSLYKIG